MCAVVFYRKRIRGRLFPVAARTGPYAFANDVTRVGGEVTSKYVGIVQVPEGKRAGIMETGPSENVVETKLGTVVIETKAERDAVEAEKGKARTSPANPNRFSGRYSDFRVSQTDSETRFLATGNYYGIHLERNVLGLDWATLRCMNCGHETEGTSAGKPAMARQLSEVASECPRCSKRALVPNAYAPDLVASRKHKIVIEIYGKKPSVRDAAKMEFYRANGFTAVTVSNEVADNPEYSKPIFQLLGLLCGSDHPDRLFIPEIG